MSWSFQTGLAAGWCLSAEAVTKFPEELREELILNDYLIPLKSDLSYTPYIFGVPLVSSLSDNGYFVHDVKAFGPTDEQYEKLFTLWHKVYPNTIMPKIRTLFYGRDF